MFECVVHLILVIYKCYFCLLVSRQHMFAVRATLLSTEVLKAKSLTVDAAMQFMRMTGEVITLTIISLQNIHIYSF